MKEQEIKGVLTAGSFGAVMFISSGFAAPCWLSAAPLHLALFCSRSHKSCFFSDEDL